MKGKDLIKWIQDNHAEDMEVFLTEDLYCFARIDPRVVDGSDDEGMMLSAAGRESWYADRTNYPEGSGYQPAGEQPELFLEKFVLL